MTWSSDQSKIKRTSLRWIHWDANTQTSGRPEEVALSLGKLLELVNIFLSHTRGRTSSGSSLIHLWGCSIQALPSGLMPCRCSLVQIRSKEAIWSSNHLQKTSTLRPGPLQALHQSYTALWSPLGDFHPPVWPRAHWCYRAHHAK